MAPGDTHGARRHIKMLAYFTVIAAASTLWYFSLGTLLASRGTALIAGWEVTSIATGSMAPALSVGDLIAYDPVEATKLNPGQIIVFDDPARPGSALVHRLVEQNDDGTLTTKGDANEREDSTPVPAQSVLGVVKMVTPFGGIPTMWLERSEFLPLAILLTLLLVSVVIVYAPDPAWLGSKPTQTPGLDETDVIPPAPDEWAGVRDLIRHNLTPWPNLSIATRRVN